MEYNIDGAIWYGGEDENDGDYCGKDCYWKIEDDTLTICGSGDLVWMKEIYDYECPGVTPNMARGMQYHKVVIKEGIKSINRYAFIWAPIETAEIAGSVGEVAQFAFVGCGRLREVRLKSGITSIMWRAFQYCESLDKITLPDSMKYIWYDAFFKCGKLKIDADENNENYTAVDGVLFSKDKSQLLMFRGYDAYAVPNGVTEIGDGAFYDCTLTKVIIPNSVTRIGEGAFECCASLESIVIPKGATEIGEHAFSGCKSLKSIVIPNGVTEIKDEMFCNCVSLKSIVIPKSVTAIGEWAFCNTALESFVIPDGVTAVGEWTFAHCNFLTSAAMPSSVTEIGYAAFEYCEALESIVISENVKKIADNAFGKCSALRKVVFGGTRQEWEKITVGEGNEPLFEAEIAFGAGG